jgi:sulfopyruvate decarboxylase subunit beta
VKPDDLVLAVAEAALENGAAVFTGNGNLPRALSTLLDRRTFFYMTGSMGLCASIAAGFANRSRASVVALEGDGNLLMGSSALPAVAKAAEGRTFVHVVVDNAQCETTGGQKTLSPEVDMCGVAAADGYDSTRSVRDLDELAAALSAAFERGGRTFIHAVVGLRASPKHPRPRLEPSEIAERFVSEAREQGWSVDSGERQKVERA